MLTKVLTKILTDILITIFDYHLTIIHHLTIILTILLTILPRRIAASGSLLSPSPPQGAANSLTTAIPFILYIVPSFAVISLEKFLDYRLVLVSRRMLTRLLSLCADIK